MWIFVSIFCRYCLVEEVPTRRSSTAGGGGDIVRSGGAGGGGGRIDLLGASAADDEDEDVNRASKDRMEEDLQIFWSYITNMLINLESLSLEAIFRMLKMFAMQGAGSGAGGSGSAPTGEYNIDVVRQFLDKKVREHELVFVAGLYKLPPKN